jgi:hypothetical protein
MTKRWLIVAGTVLLAACGTTPYGVCEEKDETQEALCAQRPTVAPADAPAPTVSDPEQGDN